MSHKKSLYAYFLSCAFIFSLVLIYPNWNNTGANATLSWDVMGYYTYLPAKFIYNDLAHLEFREAIQNTYHPTGLDHAGYLNKESGNHIMKYPMGMSIAYLPWFSMAHTMAIFSDYPADGFSFPYHFFVAFGCLVYAFIGLWFLRKILLRYFDDGISAITLLLIAIGTNYLNYTAFDMAMPHNFLFTLLAILVWTTIRWYESPTYSKSIVIGICIGWAALARPTEIVIAIIPILWGLSNWESVKNRFSLWQKHFGKIILAGAVVGAIGMLQIIYWKLYAGRFLEYSYREEGFSWWGIHLKNCFFSYRKGWLIYTPLMFFSIIGFVFYWIKNKTFTFSNKNFWAVFIYFLINTYIIFSWDIWWYGGGFGQRAMIPSYVLLALPLAGFLERINNNIFTKLFFTIPILFCVGLNLHQTWQAHAPRGGFETENMTKAYYWKIFGTTNADPDWKILLDTDEEFLGEPKSIQQIYTNDFALETDSLSFHRKHTTSDSIALYLSQSVQYSPKFSSPLSSSIDADWIRATGDFFCENKEWNYWTMCQLIISLEQDDQIVKEKMIRVHRLLQPNQWRKISIDLEIPKGVTFNNVKVKLWNAGGTREIWMDDLVLEIFKE